MDVRKFLDAYDVLYSDLLKRTAADVPKEDLIIVRNETGFVFAVDRRTGDTYRNKKESPDKDNR
jgi:hypothetical protein